MKRHSNEGFALIVVTAMFVAFAMLAAAVIDRSNATQQLDAIAKTREKLSKLSNAIIAYSLLNSDQVGYEYPCPAAMNVASTDVAFGTSVANCDSITPAGTTLLPASAMISGMVPVSELLSYGILREDAFDAWNNRIVYVVDRGMTTATPTASAAGLRANVRDYVAGEYFVPPDFIVMSYGKDGLGATPKAQVSVVIACPLDSTNRSMNCDDTDRQFYQAPINTGPNVGAGDYFDDILSFYGRTE
jgi:hypothetical protein